MRRIEGLPNNVLHLVFSPDGSRLAAALVRGGLRVYAKEHGWDEAVRDEDYQGRSGGAAFAPDGRLATTSFDRKLRLYSPGVAGTVRPTVTVEARGGRRPLGIAFSPTDGARLAVGYDGGPPVDVLDGHTLANLPSPDRSGIKANTDLAAVTWSHDGGMLLASGGDPVANSVFAWSEAGAGARRLVVNMTTAVGGLVGLPGGDLLAAAASPSLTRVGPDGTPRWTQKAPLVNFQTRAIA